MDRTDIIRRRYDRISRIYNLMELGMETGHFKRWRERLMSYVKGPRVLEVGVGTGANMPYYPRDLNITAIDFSPGMLNHARQKMKRLGIEVDLRLMDVQDMEFEDDQFDTVFTACVFCSVPDPVKGLWEIHRVLKPDGRLLMIEHVLSYKPVLRQVMQLINPLTVGIAGANINRETRRNLEYAGFMVEEEDLWLDILKFFRASPA